MALVNKQDPKKIFASQAPSQDVPAQFNNYERGWDESRKNNGKPTIKQFNKLQQLTDEKILWIHQNGAALPFDETMEYAEGAVVVKDGELRQLKDGNWQTVKQKGVGEPYQEGVAYNVGDEVRIDNGDRVRSTIPNNTNNPNTDMTGWVKTNDTSQIFDGSDSQHDLNAEFKATRDLFVTPEMFGGKANDPAFDNTTALNAAFATGKDVYSTPDKTYHVLGILNSKGQRLIGDWSINTTRHNLGKVSVNSKVVPVDKYIRMAYVESAYDLVEMLHIKSLGFNMIHHYAHFLATTYDVDGTVDKLLDNCKSAGLMVNMSTTSPPSREGALGDFITNYSKHDAVFGWAIDDEPASRNISVTVQNESVDWFKTLTNKPISIVDAVPNDNIFNQVFSTKYDIVFSDPYSRGHVGDGRNLEARVNDDLARMRLSFGGMKGMIKCDINIPVLGLFIYNPPYHCGDVNQILASAKEFVKAGNGSYAAFAWDSASDPDLLGNIRDTQAFKDFLIRISEINDNQIYETDVLLFGGTTFETLWGIEHLFDKLPVLDKNTTDANVFSNAYPIVIRPSDDSTQNDRKHLVNQQTYTGIGLKNETCGVVLNTPVRKHVRAKLILGSLITTGLNGTFKLLSTSDNGYSTTVVYEEAFTANPKTFDFYSNPTKPDQDLAIQFNFISPPASAYYRTYVLGLIACSDW